LILLLEQLRSELELKIFDGLMQVVANSARSVTYRDLASWLIERALSSGAEQTIADLQHYIDSAELPYRVTVAVAAITLTERCDIGHGITFLPWDQLPDSYMKRKIAQQFSSGIHQPSAALIRYHMQPRRHVPDTQSLDLSMDFGDLQDALLCVGPLYTTKK
jgi:hypothetical protein